MKDEDDIQHYIERCGKFCLRNIRWLTRAAIIFAFLFLLFNKIVPDIASSVGNFFGLTRPSLAMVLALVALIIVIERVLIIEAKMFQHPIQAYGNRVEAYKEFSRTIEDRGAKKVDLIQYSGQTALPLLRDIAESRPKAEVRMLLAHPDVVSQFDSDGHPSHSGRISATIEEIRLIEDDYKEGGFKVDIRYYKTPASIASVVVDDEYVSVGWYYCFKDKNTEIVRLRGHNAPAVNALDWHASGLLEFLRQQFDTLWDDEKDVRTQ
jgi:hypothetical protein